MEIRDLDADPGQLRPAFLDFIHKQIQRMRSPEILDQVIDDLQLAKVWGMGGQRLPIEEVEHRLLRSLEFHDVSPTGLLEIGAYDRDPQLAANIANTIAVDYNEARLQELVAQEDRSLAQLGKVAEVTKKRMHQAFDELAATRERERIIDPNPDHFEAVIEISGLDGDDKGEAAKAKRALSIYRDAKSRYRQLRRSFEAAQMKLHGPPPMEWSPVTIWVKAEPAMKPLHFSRRRLSR